MDAMDEMDEMAKDSPFSLNRRAPPLPHRRWRSKDPFTCCYICMYVHTHTSAFGYQRLDNVRSPKDRHQEDALPRMVAIAVSRCRRMLEPTARASPFVPPAHHDSTFVIPRLYLVFAAGLAGVAPGCRGPAKLKAGSRVEV